jgi:hypothetical protein
MKQYRSLRLIAWFLNGYACLGMVLGVVSLIAGLVMRITWQMPFERVSLRDTALFMTVCLALYLIAQTIFLLLSMNEKLQSQLPVNKKD